MESKSFKTNIKKLTLANKSYRKVIFTNKHMQLVLMKLNARENIPQEVHDVTQVIKVEQGTGISIIDGVRQRLMPDSLLIINPKSSHEIIAGAKGMLLHTMYIPPEHPLDAHEKKKQT